MVIRANLTSMVPKKLIFLFVSMFILVLLQLFMMNVNRNGPMIKKPSMRSYHINYTQIARALIRENLILKKNLPNPEGTKTAPTVQDVMSTLPKTTIIYKEATKQTSNLENQISNSEERKTILTTAEGVTTTLPETTIRYEVTTKQKTLTPMKNIEKGDKHESKARFRPDDKMLFNDEFDKAKEVKSVDVLLIVLTYHKYFHRRENIRKTWIDTCHNHKKIECWFFTDSLESITDQRDKERILQEQKEHNDIIFTPIGNGIQFGLRFLHLLMWGKANYNFKFIARVDDDIMVCIDHLMWDLPNFPQTNVHYGWMHCQMQNVVYIDEGFSMYSNDLVETYLTQKGEEIMCHPFGDQQVAVWDHSLGIKGPDVYKPDNDRIHHHPPASYDNRLRNMQDICDKFIAIHGVYKDDALKFWERRGNGRFNKYPAKQPSNFCPHYPNVNINIFGGIYHHDPKRCSLNPSWQLHHHKKYSGRER